MVNTTLCYIRRGNEYLMLHRVKKENDLNRDKWIGIGGKFLDKESPEDCLLREVEAIFLDLIWRDAPFFSLKVCYEGDRLAGAVLNGRSIK